MPRPPWLPRLLGWILPVLLVGLVARIHLNRIQRITWLSASSDWSVAQPEIANKTLTGYRDDTRRTVWPGGDFALKHAVEVAQNPRENAEFSSALFLRFRNGAGIEDLALRFNSICYFALGFVATLLIAWRFGTRSAQLFAIFYFGAYPVIAVFMPGRLGIAELIAGFFPASKSELSLLSWWQRDRLSSSFLATVLPAIALLPLVRATWFTERASHASRIFVGLTLSAFALAAWRIALFSLADLILAIALALAVRVNRAAWISAGSSGSQSPISWWWLSPLTLLPGLILIWPYSRVQPEGTFSPGEWQALVLRDLAHGLAVREPHAVVLASPATSADLAYEGSLGTLTEHKWASAEIIVRICEATTAEEAQRLLEAHRVRYLVFPSWDPFFRNAGSGNPRAFISQLQRWSLPTWLRPIPYFLPPISGDTNTRVMVFEIVPDQDEAAATANLAEYFLETNSLDRAVPLRSSLDRFPTDLAAMTASLEIDIAENPASIPKERIEAITDSIRAKTDENLTLDQCARVALDLARLGQDDLARMEATRCTDEFSRADVLASTPRALLRFMALCHYYHLEFKDPVVEPLAWKLLPPGSREKIYSDQ
ncbi:MAG TPA: hypothetical protein VIM69_08015 [Opitutaceae bacterium]